MPHMLELDKELLNAPLGGWGAFDFSGVERNLAMAELDKQEENGGGTEKMAAKVTSTGTTIVASLYKDGVMVGADSRATSGHIVAQKHCMKLHKITNSIYAAGAGTAADLVQVANMIGAELQLYELNNEGKQARVVMAHRRLRQYLFQYQGYVGAYMLIAGVDALGPHLYEVSAEGTGPAKPYSADGSGSYAAIAEMDDRYRADMTEQECREMLVKALEAGMHGDNMSGNSYNLISITKEGKRAEGPLVPSFSKPPNALEGDYRFAPGTTTVLKLKTLENLSLGKWKSLATAAAAECPPEDAEMMMMEK